jgi:fatty-acyl-CoA synthase
VAHDDPLWFFYTSGTTGKPKAGMLTHGQMAFVVTNHLADLIPGTTSDDRSIAVAPLSHGAGIHALLNVARGAPTVLMPSEKMDPELLAARRAHRVSNLFTVPTIVKLLVEHPAVDRTTTALKLCDLRRRADVPRRPEAWRCKSWAGAGAVLRPGRGDRQHHRAAARHALGRRQRPQRAHRQSCGRPRTGMEVADLDAEGRPLPAGEVGEICCRGPAVFAGYHDNPEATAHALRGGWFHTGDLGRLDERGLLYITGRESDMYISGGSNVYPREVEEVLLDAPRRGRGGGAGRARPQWGEVGVAVVVRREGSDPVSGDALLAFLDGRLARYRWPRQFVFWEALPKSGYGKITKKDVRALLYERGEVQPLDPE